jgi:general secretion pathway protein D
MMNPSMRTLLVFSAVVAVSASIPSLAQEDVLALLGVAGEAEEAAVAAADDAEDAAEVIAAEAADAEAAVEAADEAVEAAAAEVVGIDFADEAEEAAVAADDEAVEAVDEAEAVVDFADEPEEAAEVEAIAVEVVIDDAGDAVEVEAAVEAATPPAVNGDAAFISEMATLERMRLKALEEHGAASLAAARKALNNGNYTEAEKLYSEAYRFIGNREGNEALRAEAEEGVAESIYRQAIMLYKQKDLQGAVQKARVAREKGHPKAPKLVAELEDKIENPPEPPPPRVVQRWHEKDYQNVRANVARRMKRARQHYVTGEYDRARAELEMILRDNPDELDAIELLRKVGDRTFDVASTEYRTTRSHMIRDVRDTWNPRNYAVDTVQVDMPAGGAKTGRRDVTKDGKTPEEVVREKMTRIEIPEISFRQANINDVISFFEQASREYDDPELPPEQRGVNFVLKQPASDVAEGPAPAAFDPFFSGIESSAAPSGFGSPVTFNARFITLMSALETVTDVTGLKYRIKDNIVMIMPRSMATDDIISRSYNVLPTLQERVSSVRREMGSSQRDTGGFMEPIADLDDTRADWKEFFKSMGVEWPDGSSVAYVPSIGKLQVANTEENLSKLESVLEDLNVTPSQIEIEARFVEVCQEDLESIGMEWLLSDNWEIASKKGTGIHEGSQRIVMKAGSGSAGLRYPSTGTAAPALGLDSAVADSVVSVASVLTNPELSFVLHLLSQRTNTDLLQAPKVVTKSGQEAIIKVVTEYIYPTSYSTETIDLDGDGSAVFADSMVPGIVTPEDFEMREVGVILQVVPEVSTEGQMINLTLNPQVVQFESWEDYGIESYRADGSVAWKLPMRQPLFNVRSINTSISIYNGATVVMGGLIEEKRYELEDKVPFLGDIPVLGRFFRSHSTNSQKKNLLIFVTARLVDPAGRSLKSSTGDTASTLGAADAIVGSVD